MKISPRIVGRIVIILSFGILISFGLKRISDERSSEASQEQKKQAKMDEAMLREKQRVKEKDSLEEIKKEIQSDRNAQQVPPSLAGEYLVIIDKYSGSSQEKYILSRDGVAAWRWIDNGKVQAFKVGRWRSNQAETEIVTTIMGQTDEIIETFTFRHGKYRSGDRYLQRIKPL